VGEAIGQILPIAVVVAISPLPIVAVVLMLTGPRGRVNAPVFVLAGALGLAAVGAIVIAAVGGNAEPDAGGTPAWVDWLKLILGLALLMVGAKQWRGRPRGDDDTAELPAWMRALDEFSWPRAAGAGVALSTLLNPKNLLLAVAGATVIAQAGLPPAQEAGALAVFVAIATIGPAAPVALFFAMGSRSRGPLEAMKGWLARNNATIMAAVLLVIAIKLVGDAITGFSE
jgi:threonine/homoserine/homoserine lactone efflux protein